ncbi:MAG: hypothetical protein AMXMBFR75_07270 [Candidatus Hinthialibacteria bacterium]
MMEKAQKLPVVGATFMAPGKPLGAPAPPLGTPEIPSVRPPPHRTPEIPSHSGSPMVPGKPRQQAVIPGLTGDPLELAFTGFPLSRE